MGVPGHSSEGLDLKWAQRVIHGFRCCEWRAKTVFWVLVRQLLSARELSAEFAAKLFERAAQFRSSQQVPAVLQGQHVLSVFYEESTRTRFSFESAARRLGAQVMTFTLGTSSVKKGESLLDSVKTLLAIAQSPSIVVLRHPSTGAARFLAQELGQKFGKTPVINAGDGSNEHPTQALLDAWTLVQALGSLKGKQIAIVGDLMHSRVAHSDLILFKTLGASLTVCGPGHLVPRWMESVAKVARDFDSILPEADAVICLRVQQNRHSEVVIPDLNEYRRFWGLTNDRAKRLKPSAVVLAPGPVNYGVEIDTEVGTSDRSWILRQVSNGVWIRMAVLAQAAESAGQNGQG